MMDEKGNQSNPESIENFLKENEEYQTLAVYQQLTDMYGDELETDLTIDSGGENPTYHLTVTSPIREKAQKKGQKSGNGTPIVSKLLGSKTQWPKEFSGDLEGVN